LKRGVCLKKSEPILNKIPTDCRASRGRTETERSGGQKFLPPNPLPFCPPERSAAAEFRISLCEMRRLFTIFDFWCSIEVIEKKYN